MAKFSFFSGTSNCPVVPIDEFRAVPLANGVLSSSSRAGKFWDNPVVGADEAVRVSILDDSILPEVPDNVKASVKDILELQLLILLVASLITGNSCIF